MEIWGNFNSTEKAILLKLVVWNFLWLVSGYLSVCKRISLDGKYFFMILMLKNGILADFTRHQNKVKLL